MVAQLLDHGMTFELERYQQSNDNSNNNNDDDDDDDDEQIDVIYCEHTTTRTCQLLLLKIRLY